MAADPFEAALAEIEGDQADPFEAALAQVEQQAPPPDVGYAESAGRGLVQGGTFSFGDEIKGAIGAGYYGVAKGVRSLLPGGVPEGAPSVGEVYRSIRDDERTANAEAYEANPITYGTGEVGGVLAGSGVNPVSLVRAGGRSLLGLATREAYTAAAGRALLTQGAKGAVGGAGFGAVSGAGSSQADLTQGEYEQFFTDVVGGAKTGAKIGAVAGGLLGAGSTATAQRAERLAGDAAAAKAAQDFDAALAAYPDELAAIKAANAAEKQAAALENVAAKEAAATQNAAAREAASAQNATAREAASAENAARRLQYRTDTAAAKAEAKAATKANQTAAQEAELAEARANPLRRTGLESKLQSQYGPKVAKARAQALVDEAMPGQPGKRLIEEAEKLSPEARFDYAQGLRMGEGGNLGRIRDELAKVPGASVPAAPIKVELKEALGQLPAEAQAKGLKQIEGMIAKVAKGGSLSPAALRKLIEDTNALAKFGSPRLEAALGRSQKRIFRSAYTALVNRERELIGKVLPEARAAEYTEALRKYAVYSDFEQSADVLLRRSNKGLPAIRVKKAAPVAPVSPREVAAPEKAKAAKVQPQLQEPTLREPLLKPEPTPPEFAGGDEALAAGRKLLQPSLGARVVAGGMRLAAGDAAARAGALLLVPGSAVAAQRLASAGTEVVAERWLRWVTATPGSLSAKAEKLERLQPMMEEALSKGPAEVARLHALFMARSPDYRKAIESDE